MSEVSNRTLVVMLLVTMGVSLFGTMMSLNAIGGLKELTGAWNGITTNSTYASVNLTVSSQLRINFTIDKADFGSGYVKPGAGACVLSTGITSEDTTGCSGFTVPGSVNALYLENIGNEYAKLNISNINYSSSLIGGTNPGYAWQWTPETPGEANVTCNTTGKHVDLPSPTTDPVGAPKLVNLTSTNYPGEDGYETPGKQLCGIFNYSANNNAINITLKIHIPQNAPPRTLSDTWFAFASPTS
ncbi:hypothetical protein D6777_01520 [Candidatus Woesearchaeota archaeon]|nr:MAG: hypothetical protein D6777_01520 [Candidatus Woesearchaeota archaeon]